MKPFFLLLLLLIARDSATGAAGAVLGGWKPIENINDPHVLEIGKFAVSEHNNQVGSGGGGGGGPRLLAFSRVVKGESQVVAGVNYRLMVEAKEAGGATTDGSYEAVVWEQQGGTSRKLTSFKPISG